MQTSHRRYRRKFSVALLFSALISAIAFAVFVYALVFVVGMLTSILSMRSPDVLLLGPLFVMVALSFLLLTLNRLDILIFKVGNIFLSYAQVSPEGLEVRSWPFYRLRCAWQNLEREGKAPTWGASYEIVHLKDAESLPEGRLAGIVGWLPRRVTPRWRRRSFAPRSFRGYPGGDFEDDLRRYAPHLFDAEAGADTLA